MSTPAIQAYADSTYRDILGIQNEKEMKHAEEWVRALGRLDATLLPPAFSHPLQHMISAGPDALSKLMPMVEKSDEIVQLRALDAVAHIFMQGGVTPVCVMFLKRCLKTETNMRVKACLAKCIALSGDNEFLSQQCWLLDNEDPGIVASAARLLGYGAYAPALPALKLLVSPTRFYESSHVIWALGEIGNPEALPVLEYALANGFQTMDCLFAMGKIGQLTSIPCLTQLISEGLPEQREAAYQAMATILNANREYPELRSILGESMTALILRQLEEVETLTPACRFYMLLCLSRMEYTLEVPHIRRYLGVEMNEKEAGDMAAFFMRRGASKTVQ